jgi:phosphonate transport system permease protein
MKSLVRRSIFDAIIFAYFLTAVAVFIAAPEDDQAQMALVGRWPLGVLFLLLGWALSFGLNKMGHKTLGELTFESAHSKATSEGRPWHKTFWGWQLVVFLVLTLVLGFQATRFSLTELLDKDGFDGAMRLFAGLLHPNMGLLPRAILNIIETIFIAFIATAMAIPVAFIMCFFCAKNIMKGNLGFAVYTLLRTSLNITRAIEALIWAIIFSVWVGIGPFAGMLALFVHSIASLAKQYSEIVETVSDGPIEGIQSTGATQLQTIWFAIVPQVILPFISFTIYRWDINVRMATIIGLVGGGGIGTMLIKYQGQAMWPEVGCIIMVIAFVVWFMDTASAYIREALK